MARAGPSAPEISVIVPSYNAARTIRNSLAALAAQRTVVAHEVIVVDSGRDETARVVEAEFPAVRLVRVPERRYPGGARNLGVARAGGAILAFTDADCVAAPDWVDALHAAHRAGHPVVGGVVANANPEGLVACAYYFTEFNRWMPGTPAGHVDDVPGCCWSMTRAAYDRYGPFLEAAYCSDTLFHWRMAADGLRPYLDPRVGVAHVSPTRWRECLRHEPMHGRWFARLRARERALSRRRLFLHVATTPVLPALLFVRVLRRVASTRERRRFLRASPLVAVSMAGWAWGEMRGYVEALRRPPVAG
jgi:GT2 family glycosyltransferase